MMAVQDQDGGTGGTQRRAFHVDITTREIQISPILYSFGLLLGK